MSYLKTVPSPLEHSLILICEKCGAKGIMESDANPSHQLQQEIKRKTQETLPKGQIKAVITGCLSICPENEISIGITNFKTNRTIFKTIAKDKVSFVVEEIFQTASSRSN